MNLLYHLSLAESRLCMGFTYQEEKYIPSCPVGSFKIAANITMVVGDTYLRSGAKYLVQLIRVIKICGGIIHFETGDSVTNQDLNDNLNQKNLNWGTASLLPSHW